MRPWSLILRRWLSRTGPNATPSDFTVIAPLPVVTSAAREVLAATAKREQRELDKRALLQVLGRD